MNKDRTAHGGSPADTIPWRSIVSVADVPPTGRQVDLEADEATREAIAGVAGVLAVPRLEASFDLALHGSDSLRVTGRIVGTVEQNCVVTLEPLKGEIDEEVDLLFTPPRDLPKG